MASDNDITGKKYRKLVMKVSQSGFSFCYFDTLTGRINDFKEISFEKFPRTNKVEDHFWNAFVDNHELTKSYDEVLVLHDNNLNSFVPKALFDEDYLGSYLQYNTQVFETDYFTYDEIANYDICNVYIPYVHINNFLIDQFGPFTYKSANSVLIKCLLDLSKNIEERQMFAHLGRDRFEVVVVENQKLQLFNSFDYRTKEDFLYYLLFTAEQLGMNPEQFKLHLLGNISKDNDYFKIAYKYIRNVGLLDVSDLRRHNEFTSSENLRHFILFQP